MFTCFQTSVVNFEFRSLSTVNLDGRVDAFTSSSQ
uniref:Uncharacterized protein n=1 Tax=Rhizophora mucronata TaxID=61149 RepID=A0A2P2JCD8_RHIMU